MGLDDRQTVALAAVAALGALATAYLLGQQSPNSAPRSGSQRRKMSFGYLDDKPAKPVLQVPQKQVIFEVKNPSSVTKKL